MSSRSSPDSSLEPRLLAVGGVATSLGIRQRLLTIVALGVITSALSLFGLVRILSLTTAQRLDRAREAVAEETERIAARPALDEAPGQRSSLIGARGGIARGDDEAALEGAPAAWRAGIVRVVREAIEAKAKRSGEAKLGEATLVVCAIPVSNGVIAWSAYLVGVPPYLRIWQSVVVLLAAATLLLVGTAVWAMVTVRRSADDIGRALVALATDLEAPIPRPPLKELAGIAEGIEGLARSLAKARAAEEQLGKELAAQERLAALGRVVAGVAHEVRNPLASIKLRLDLAAAAGDVPEPLARAVAHATEEIARLDRLVADLLAASGRAVGPRVETSLGELARARVDALAPWAEARDVSLRVHGDATARVDKDSLARALDNLVKNAIEASPVGGVVEVDVAASEHGARVRVEDRGKGVEPARAALLFEPFFTTKPEGTGLGLAVSRAIARGHGGDVTYAQIGAATRFEITVDDGARAEAAE